MSVKRQVKQKKERSKDIKKMETTVEEKIAYSHELEFAETQILTKKLPTVTKDAQLSEDQLLCRF